MEDIYSKGSLSHLSNNGEYASNHEHNVLCHNHDAAEKRPRIKVRRKLGARDRNVTNFQMMVESNTSEEIKDFSKEKIINSLVHEVGLNLGDAEKVAEDVEKTLYLSKVSCVTSAFIREIVNSILLQRGFNVELKQYSNLSLALSNVKQIHEAHNFENSNTGFCPESINLLIAGSILKQYALREVFSDDVSKSHLKGEIHIHDLDFINRPYCSGNSIEYVKKNGLRLPNMTASSPAKHPQTLVNHIQCFASYLQGLFAGAIGWDAVNMFFAPLFENMPYDQIKQVAQHLIFSFAQLAGNRGGQVVFSDFNLFLTIPEHYQNTPAVGIGGKYTGKNYGEYEKESRLFLKAILDVINEGDADGANFAFPKINLHVDEHSFDKNDELLMYACEINAVRGSVYILFDRAGSVKVSQCCRLSIEMTQKDLDRMSKHPDELRFSAWQNVSVNLPGIAYRSRTKEAAFKEMDRLAATAMKAHKAKYDFINKLLEIGEKGPLAFLTTGMNGKAYLRPEDAKFLVGMVGLNEMVQILTGQQLHESNAALLFGLEIIAHLKMTVDKLAAEYGFTCVLEETPAESTSGRFAQLDLKTYPEAKNYIRGIKGGDYSSAYYTNSVHLAYDSNVDIFERIEKQSMFAPMIQAGSIIHVWLGESNPDAKAIYALIKNAYNNTKAAQIAFSPDFTICQDCHTQFKGFREECPGCGSKNIYHSTRITGYFSRVSGWTKGKLAELKDRVKVAIELKNNIENVEAAENEPKYKLFFFSKEGCEKCQVVKERIKNEQSVKILETTTAEGMAYAMHYNIVDLPALIKVDNDYNVMANWNHSESVLKWLKENTNNKEKAVLHA